MTGDYKATQNPNMSLLKANICNITVRLQLTVGLQTPHTVSESLEMLSVQQRGDNNTGSAK